jgi:hypothetical protein
MGSWCSLNGTVGRVEPCVHTLVQPKRNPITKHKNVKPVWWPKERIVFFIFRAIHCFKISFFFFLFLFFILACKIGGM